jgi:hypothetical protein
MLVTGQSVFAQATINCTPASPVDQENGKALFVGSGSFNSNGVGTFEIVKLQVKEVGGGTSEKIIASTINQAGGLGDYTGSVMFDYNSTKSYKMRAILYGTVNGRVDVIMQQTAWIDVPPPSGTGS